MSSSRQGDLFRNDDDTEECEAPTWYSDPDEVHAELRHDLGADAGGEDDAVGRQTARRFIAPSFADDQLPAGR